MGPVQHRWEPSGATCADQADAGSAAPNKLVDFATKVVAISGNTLTLERPLRADVRAVPGRRRSGRSRRVSRNRYRGRNPGFPNMVYPGHLLERGYNGIYLDGVANCWVRNVNIVDADSGITTGNDDHFAITRFCTADSVRLSNRYRTGTITGHHGIALEGPQDVLVTRFNFEKQLPARPDRGTSASCGNVFAGGRGVNLNFDHHRYTPYENLFTDIDVGVGDTLWWGSRNMDSGNGDGGPISAARETVWNVRASNAMAGRGGGGGGGAPPPPPPPSQLAPVQRHGDAQVSNAEVGRCARSSRSIRRPCPGQPLQRAARAAAELETPILRRC